MRTWFVTGVSSGFGRSLSELLVSRGERVVGTLRNEAQRAAFDAISPGLSVGVLLDVTRHGEVAAIVDDVERRIGAIDVLVNNAGYGYEGTVEEATMDEIRAQFDVNVFGAVAVAQAVLPHMRRRRSGRIINITSMGGIATFAGLGIYHGSKFALEGISETLAKEVRQFGIHVTAVEPGGFRTQWAAGSMRRGALTVTDYEPLMAPIRKARLERSGQQTGDPSKAALAMLALADAQDPPVHLLLGNDALGFVRTKLDELAREIDRWEALTSSTDFTG